MQRNFIHKIFKSVKYKSVLQIPVVREPSTRIMPQRILKWLTEKQAGEVGYCLPFEDSASACPAYVGGKGASLALLTSVQTDEVILLFIFLFKSVIEGYFWF